jgi:hypothetical protein
LPLIRVLLFHITRAFKAAFIRVPKTALPNNPRAIITRKALLPRVIKLPPPYAHKPGRLSQPVLRIYLT